MRLSANYSTPTAVDSSCSASLDADAYRTYPSTLLGFPIEGTVDVSIDAFRHQVPNSSQQRVYYFVPYDLYTTSPVYYTNTMDDKVTIIGYKSTYGQKAASRAAHIVKPESAYVLRPKPVYEMVQLQQGGKVIGTASLGVLTRFSRKAKELWPKTQGIVKATSVGSTGQEVRESATPGQAGCVSKEAKKAAPPGQNAVKVGKLSRSAATDSKKWADMAEELEGDIADLAESDKSTKGSGITVSARSGDPKCERARINATGPKILHVHLDDVDVQPDRMSFEYLLKWMDANKGRRHEEPLLPIIPVPLQTVKLMVVLEHLTAAMALNLSPFPQELRIHFMDRITNAPVTLEEFEYISLRVPLADKIITRLLTAHFEHIDADRYPPCVAEQIDDFVKMYDSNLENAPYWNRYNQIQKSHEHKKRKERKNQQQAEKLKHLRGTFETLAGPGAIIGEQKPQPATRTAAQPAGTGEHDRRRRNRREQQRQGQRQDVESTGMKQALGRVTWHVIQAKKGAKGSHRAGEQAREQAGKHSGEAAGKAAGEKTEE